MTSQIIFVNIALVLMNAVYLYILCGPVDTPDIPQLTKKFAIDIDTFDHWNETLTSFKREMSGSGWGWDNRGFHDDYSGGFYDDFEEEIEDNTPIEPSTKFRCPPHPPDWITIRSEINYKFLWLHGSERNWMTATATIDTPLHHKAFEVVPVQSDCTDGGWVRLRESDREGFLRMVPPSPVAATAGGGGGDVGVGLSALAISADDEWTVHSESSDLDVTKSDQSYHFLLEEEGYLLNRQSMAFVNVIMPSNEVRGHGSSHYRNKPARREYSAMMRFQFINDTVIADDRDKELRDEDESQRMDQELIQKIKAFPRFTEKRVISFGLYGKAEKYTVGAIRNAELAKIYFPGWICRFYVNEDVPTDITSKLKDLGAEVVGFPSGEGYASGMFWRFLVASDDTVDRFIIRDTDSRMNSRDAMAVQEWIASALPVHIMRDHVNHCHTMNGGMWGGVKGSLSQMKSLISAWNNKDQYFADMSFLDAEIWPLIKEKHIAHDSYCCDRFEQTRPFPSKRLPNYQHVGQVFDAEDSARLLDIDGFIRGVPTPHSCRLNSTWIYG